MGFDGVKCDDLVRFWGFRGTCEKPEFSQKHLKSRSYPSSAHEIPKRFHGAPSVTIENPVLWGLMVQSTFREMTGWAKTICDLTPNRV
ncbi:hypothetical protein TH30_18870 [Thalassospira profundimaris]|uniref:Uncharacterized protein n=1 Tax=Thalassospira profundimaris TaxID=502049 RepID=A0A367WPS9_9PROT|nr:hypothetical protein TH30_18870 [Thalassospira profundimaris]